MLCGHGLRALTWPSQVLYKNTDVSGSPTVTPRVGVKNAAPLRRSGDSAAGSLNGWIILDRWSNDSSVQWQWSNTGGKGGNDGHTGAGDADAPEGRGSGEGNHDDGMGGMDGQSPEPA